MATLAEVVKRQRQGGRGVIGSLTSAIGQKTLEAIDPRRMLNQRGLLTSLFPSLKAYQAGGGAERISRASADLSSSTAPMLQEMNMKLDIVGDNTRLTAKNTMMMPSMARDMNVMRQNIVKLVKLQGGKASTRADGFFLRSFERERATESELQAAKARRLTSTTPTPEKKDDGGPGILGMLGGALGLSAVIGTLSKAITSIPSLILSGLSSILSPLSTLKDLLSQGIKLILPGIGSVVPGILKSTAGAAMSLGSMTGKALFPLLRFLIPFAGPAALAGLIGWLAWKVFSDEDLTVPGVGEGLGQDTLKPGSEQQIYEELKRQKLKSVSQIKTENPKMSNLDAINAHNEQAMALKDEARKIAAGETTENSESVITALNQSDVETERLKRQSQDSTTPSPAPAAPSTGTEPTKFQNGVSQNLIETVKRLEGFSAKAYPDEKQYSIGYGTKANSPDEVIDEAEAERRLIRDLNERQKYVIDYAKRYNYDWNQNQIDSLTSFIYNLGKGALDQVTAGGKRSTQEIIEKMPLYNKAGGEVKEGLVRRRATEVAMFAGTPQMTPPSMATSSPTSGTQIASASSAIADSRFTQSQQPVTINAPTTNVSQGQGGGQISGIMADTMDKELASLLVDRMVGA